MAGLGRYPAASYGQNEEVEECNHVYKSAHSVLLSCNREGLEGYPEEVLALKNSFFRRVSVWMTHIPGLHGILQPSFPCLLLL